jgi:hypothetical protein
MQNIAQNIGRQWGRLNAAIATAALTWGAPLLAQTPGHPVATSQPTQTAAAAGGNLGMGAGAAPLPEPSTWIGVGTLLAAVAVLAVVQRRRRKAG